MHEIESGAQRAGHVAGLSEEERELLECFAQLSELDRSVVLLMARTARRAQEGAR